MGTKSRGEENDPFAKPGERSSWSGTAKPPPPGPPLPPGSPGTAAGSRVTPTPVPPGPTPPTPPTSAPIATPPGAHGYPPPSAGSTMYPPPSPSTSWGASSSKNWMGITSLVLGVTCIGAGLLGAIFGHLGLAACKRGEANNRGLTLAGVIVNYSMFCLGLAGLVFALATAGDAGRPSTPTHTSGFATQNAEPTQGAGPTAEPTAAPTIDAAAGHPLDTSLAISRYWYDLTVGDCVSAFYAAEPDESGDYPFQDPTVVPCSEPHYGEVYALALIGGTEAPDDAVFQAHTAQLCEGPAFTDYVGVSDYFDSALYYDVLYPNPEAWKDGGHEMVCVVVEESGTTVGSLRDSGL